MQVKRGVGGFMVEVSVHLVVLMYVVTHVLQTARTSLIYGEVATTVVGVVVVIDDLDCCLLY